MADDAISPFPHKLLAIQAACELEAQLEVLRDLAAQAADQGHALNAEFARGLAIRAKQLTDVMMSVIDGDIDEARARATVYGEAMKARV